MRTKTLLLLLTIACAAFLAACGGGEESSAEPAVANLTVTQDDNYFGSENDNVANPETWTVASGAPVLVKVENQGVLEHNWAVIKAGESVPDVIETYDQVEDIILYDVGTIAAGESANGRFVAPEPGEYTIICTVAGHWPTMQGKLVVE